MRGGLAASSVARPRRGRHRKNIAVLVGMFILAFAVPAVAQAAPVDWELSYANGALNNQNRNGPECSAPCALHGRITDPKGQTITSADWYEGDNVNTSPRHPGQEVDWHADWTFPNPGTYNVTLVVRFADGSQTIGGGQINVTDSSNVGASVAYVGSATLNQADPAANTFQVDYTGQSLDVVDTSNSTQGHPVELRKWNDASGHHKAFRMTDAPTGHNYLRMTSGDKTIYQDLNVTGGPFYFTNLRVKQYHRKKAQVCTYGTRLSVHATTPAKAQVKVRLQGRLPGGRWKTLATGGTKPVSRREGTWSIKARLRLPLATGTLASYLHSGGARFRYVVDKTSIRRADTNKLAYNPRAKRYPLAPTKLKRCSLETPPISIAVL